MIETKVRLKSIVRDPSHSFKSWDFFKANVLKHIGKEYLNIDSNKKELEQYNTEKDMVHNIVSEPVP